MPKEPRLVLVISVNPAVGRYFLMPSLLRGLFKPPHDGLANLLMSADGDHPTCLDGNRRRTGRRDRGGSRRRAVEVGASSRQSRGHSPWPAVRTRQAAATSLRW